MKHWNERPIEVRNLFNPAFCGLVLYRSMAAFQEVDPRGVPFSLSLLILPLTLQRHSREILQSGIRSHFLKVAAEHPELQVGFAKRCIDIFPFTLEALGVLTSVGTATVEPDGRLLTRPEGVRRTVSGTDESKSCQRTAVYLGKEFAKIGRASCRERV